MDIKLNINVNELNIILNALSKDTYINVYELINKLQIEAEKQLRKENN